jgi:type II secretory pathway component PulF
LKREISKWTPEMERGVTPADAIAQIRYFPDMFVQLYQSGEMSGKTDEALAHLSTYFEDEGFRKLQAFCRVVMFLVYFSVAGAVGYFVINFYVGRFASMMNGF